ncbi:MAG TPA: polysaccharide pyruvyl transferase family protein [Egibacteraceae bacterium]|nr:polysaccharide pyruvyl transferase family protein [Egibacteraceae bacterium]
MTRVLVAAWVGSTNLGDELVFAGLRRKLVARGVAVAALSVDPRGTAATHGVQALDHRDLGGLVHAVGEADAVVFGGGGLLQDETSLLNLPYHLSRLQVARRRHTPFAVVGVGAGRLDTRLGRALVRRGLRSAVAVSARDTASARLLGEVGVEGVRVSADLALALDPPPVQPADRLVACLRPWSAGRKRVPAGLRADTTPPAVVHAAARGLDEAASATGLPVHLVALQADRDDAFHRRVAERMRTPATTASPSLAGVLVEVARSRAVVAMRYHGGIGAVLGGRPCVLVGYAPKVDALAGELGPGGALLPWSAEGMTGVAGALGGVMRHADAVVEARERLRARERGNDAVLDELLATGGGGRVPS